MPPSRLLRPLNRLSGQNSLARSPRRYASAPPTIDLPNSPFAPRHLLSIADLTPIEFSNLVRNADAWKTECGSGNAFMEEGLAKWRPLLGRTVAMSFSKRSTRTRVSTEGAVALLGGHPMFLGKDDIQLGVNESLYDTSVIISSMSSCIVARVGPHSDVASLAKHSSVPVINALSDMAHPLQTVADFQTIFEVKSDGGENSETLGLEGLKIAWVGDANNVLFDLAIASLKLGVHISVATPKGYEIPQEMQNIIMGAGADAPVPGQLTTTNTPEEAIKDADIIVTDTWISMGQEEEKAARLKAFKGYQVTSELAKRGGAKEDWTFMHCLPRHPEEVSDEVFYGPRSVVFQEGENRLWAATSVLEAFVVHGGKDIDKMMDEEEGEAEEE